MKLQPDWEYVSDHVMGGMSRGQIDFSEIEGTSVCRLTGSVSLENNGGFVQMAFDLSDEEKRRRASGWAGLEIEVRGNEETYDLRLRTAQLTRPWQSFRTDFVAKREWQKLRFPFENFIPHRTETMFDPRDLRRVGILGIGRVFEADVSVRSVTLYR